MGSTSMVEEIAAKAAGLSYELQRQTLDFIEFISQRTNNSASVDKDVAPSSVAISESQPQFKSVLGSLEHLGVHITREDIAEVRGEMWANFPREEPR